MSDSLESVEQMAKQALYELEREYKLRAQPYIDILCRIEACRPSPILVVSIKDWELYQLDKKEGNG